MARYSSMPWLAVFCAMAGALAIAVASAMESGKTAFMVTSVVVVVKNEKG
jgi:hypothetical protein